MSFVRKIHIIIPIPLILLGGYEMQIVRRIVAVVVNPLKLESIKIHIRPSLQRPKDKLLSRRERALSLAIVVL
jgi:hypothetical protein